jgi:ribosomal protein S18 acetylase RimI-like enzyme
MNIVDFITGGIELLDIVQPLWEKLNKHHKANSTYFQDKFNSLTFDMRKKKFINDINTELRIDLVKDSGNHRFVGYCISTVTIDLVGEIDSLYIEPGYRKLGIGDILMDRSLFWLDSKNVKTKVIGVAQGNEQAFDFYKKYGFYTRRTILEQVSK